MVPSAVLTSFPRSSVPAGALSSAEGCVNEADLVLKSQAGELALDAQFAGGPVNREVED